VQRTVVNVTNTILNLTLTSQIVVTTFCF